MKILAMDTAFNACSVTLLDAETNKAVTKCDILERGHAERLVPMIEDVLREAGSDYADIDALAVTTGPGAFTGMRIGLSTAKALSAAIDKPLIGVSSFHAMLKSCQYHFTDMKNHQFYAVLLETKRDDFYFAVLDNTGCEVSHGVCSSSGVISQQLKSLDNVILVGDAVNRFISETNFYGGVDAGGIYEITHPNTYEIACIALNIFNKSDYPATVLPVYLRPADVTIPKTAQHYLN